jgi:hypothetical protein
MGPAEQWNYFATLLQAAANAHDPASTARDALDELAAHARAVAWKIEASTIKEEDNA